MRSSRVGGSISLSQWIVLPCSSAISVGRGDVAGLRIGEHRDEERRVVRPLEQPVRDRIADRERADRGLEHPFDRRGNGVVFADGPAQLVPPGAELVHRPRVLEHLRVSAARSVRIAVAAGDGEGIGGERAGGDGVVHSLDNRPLGLHLAGGVADEHESIAIGLAVGDLLRVGDELRRVLALVILVLNQPASSGWVNSASSSSWGSASCSTRLSRWKTVPIESESSFV